MPLVMEGLYFTEFFPKFNKVFWSYYLGGVGVAGSFLTLLSFKSLSIMSIKVLDDKVNLFALIIVYLYFISGINADTVVSIYKFVTAESAF